MRLFTVLTIFCWLTALAVQGQDIQIKGSDTMLPLVEGLIELYANESNKKITVQGGGSGTGVSALQSGNVNIAMSSRPLKDSEKGLLIGLKHKEIAYDALSVIVNPTNSVNRLTKQQVSDIFTGKVRNWQAFGGPDLPITVYTRDSKSGTYDFMKTFVMEGGEYVGYAKELASNSGIVQAVTSEKGAIGYVGMAYVEDIVQTVAISVDGKNYIAPTFRSALEKKYPIIRALYLYYLPASEKDVKGFLDFILSPIGQKLASYKGYIPAAF